MCLCIYAYTPYLISKWADLIHHALFQAGRSGSGHANRNRQAKGEDRWNLSDSKGPSWIGSGRDSKTLSHRHSNQHHPKPVPFVGNFLLTPF